MFGEAQLSSLRAAVGDLAWLFARGYAQTSALKLVGDRYELRARQRTAVLRCTCTDAEAKTRGRRRLALSALAGRELAIDGFNVLIAVEVALAAGVLIRGRDRSLRDLASVHGSYRRTEHTLAAARAVGEAIASAGAGSVLWLLDRPVSNSGRLAGMLSELSEREGWGWEVELDYDPDRRLAGLEAVVATGDAWILDQAEAHVDLASAVICARYPDAWIVDLADPGAPV